MVSHSTASAMAPSAPTKPIPFEPESLPSVTAATASLSDWSGDLLVVPVFEDDLKTEEKVTTLSSSALQQLDAGCAGALAEIVSVGGFEAKQGTSSVVVRVGAAPGCQAKYVALVGLGKRDQAGVTPTQWGPSAYQALGSAVAVLAKANKSRTVAVAPQELPQGAAGTLAVQQMASGLLLGAYETTRFKSVASPTASRLDSVLLMLPSAGDAGAPPAQALTAALAKAVVIARGTLFARYLVEAPPNVCTPSHLAEAAQHIAAAAPDVMTLEVLDAAQCKELGMGLYLGVAESSDEPLKFIHLTYKPVGGASKKVAIVGKGVTFDSGGYNIKTGPGCLIELMKFDMGGAGATLGAAHILSQSKPSGVEVHFLVAACENMVAGNGLRPGDVLTAACSGKTVEVNNTDAEGRLTLADALWFAQAKCGATSIVDIATLTGACMIALGGEIAGFFTPSETVAAEVAAAAKLAGEKVWRMPLEPNYWAAMKSPIADMRNSGDRYGGSITGALFLQQYIKEGVEWAHIDAAGPVWDQKTNQPTGFGAALLSEWAVAQGATSGK